MISFFLLKIQNRSDCCNLTKDKDRQNDAGMTVSRLQNMPGDNSLQVTLHAQRNTDTGDNRNCSSCRRLMRSARGDRLVGLVVRRPPRERRVPGSNPACAGIFSGSSHTSDLKIGTPVATLPGAWRYRVSAGTGRPGVSIL